MDKIKLNDFLKSMTYGMDYKVLDYAKDKEELDTIAKKHHLRIPAKDLSIFKGIYAFVDKENLNGCTLPKDEVEKALDTLNGKSVDFDHLRKKIVGYWLEGSIESSKIIAYGIFFKGSLAEEYDELITLFTEGNLKISFEAWGNRVITNEKDESYDLTDIEFAGGALLLQTKPAFAGASVLEFASKNMSEPKMFVYTKEEKEVMNKTEQKYLEYSQFCIYDFETILRLIWEVVCPACKAEYSQDVNMIDFQNSIARTTCLACGATCEVTMTPKAKVLSTANAVVEKRKVIEIKKLDNSSVQDDQNKRKALEETKTMDELQKLQAEIASIKVELKAKEDALTAKEQELVTVKASLEEAKVALETAKTAQEAAIVKAKEDTAMITTRKAELGEFAKDMSDEDILNSDKYEIAKLKKENAELKVAKKPETASTGLEIGSKTKEKTEIETKQKSVRTLAFS